MKLISLALIGIFILAFFSKCSNVTQAKAKELLHEKDTLSIAIRYGQIYGELKSLTRLRIKTNDHEYLRFHFKTWNGDSLKPNSSYIANNSVEIPLSMVNVYRSNLLVLKDSVELCGVVMLGDSVLYQTSVFCKLKERDHAKFIIYEDYMAGKYEKNIGMKIPKSLIKNLELSNLRPGTVGALYYRIPKNLGSFSNLKLLKLNGIPPTSFPSDFNQLKNLEDLSITQSGDYESWKGTVFSVPDFIFELPKLKSLGLSHFSNLKFPDNIPISCKLTSLYASTSNTVYLSPTITHLSNLKHLTLNLHNINYSIPDNMNNLNKLEHLEIGFQKEGKVPKEFGPWTNLIEGRIIVNDEILSKNEEEIIMDNLSQSSKFRLVKY